MPPADTGGFSGPCLRGCGSRGAEPAGDRLLAHPWFPADQPEQPGLGAGEVERCDPLAEPFGRVGAELREQAGDIRLLSTLTLLTSALDFTLPIARFGGLIFIVAVSALLPATRHRLTAATPVAA